MSVRRSVRVLERRSFDSESQVSPYPVQIPGHKGEAHDFRANPRQRVVHRAHRQAEGRNTDARVQRASVHNPNGCRQQAPDHSEQDLAPLTQP